MEWRFLRDNVLPDMLLNLRFQQDLVVSNLVFNFTSKLPNVLSRGARSNPSGRSNAPPCKPKLALRNATCKIKDHNLSRIITALTSMCISEGRFVQHSHQLRVAQCLQSSPRHFFNAAQLPPCHQTHAVRALLLGLLDSLYTSCCFVRLFTSFIL